MPKKNLDELMNSDQVATKLGITKRRVQDLAQEGKLKGHKLGRDWMFSKIDVEEFAGLARPAHRPPATSTSTTSSSQIQARAVVSNNAGGNSETRAAADTTTTNSGDRAAPLSASSSLANNITGVARARVRARGAKVGEPNSPAQSGQQKEGENRENRDSRKRSEERSGHMGGLTLALVNQKGGVGKTTTVAALATIYAQAGLRVLVIDSDPQGNASLQLGVDALGTDIPTISDVYRGTIQAHEAAVATAIKGVSLVPATVELAEVEMILPGKQGGDVRLRSALKEAREFYDLILLDSPPNLGKFCINVLAAADWFLIPVSGSWSIRSVQVILDRAENNRTFYGANAQFMGLFITMAERTRIMNSLREFNQENYDGYILKSEIRRSTLAREAEAMAQPVPLYAHDTGLSQDYQELAAEIANRLGLKIKVKIKKPAAPTPTLSPQQQQQQPTIDNR